MLSEDEKYIHLFKLKTTLPSTMLNKSLMNSIFSVRYVEVKISEDFTRHVIPSTEFQKNNLKRRNFFSFSFRALINLETSET